jgi:hypothetical protein
VRDELGATGVLDTTGALDTTGGRLDTTGGEVWGGGAPEEAACDGDAGGVTGLAGATDAGADADMVYVYANERKEGR